MHANVDISVEVTLDDEDEGTLLVVAVPLEKGIFCCRVFPREFFRGVLEATIDSCKPNVSWIDAIDAMRRQTT